MKFFIMFAETCIEDYVKPGQSLLACKKGCRRSEYQFLNRQPLEVEISDDGGTDVPDLLIAEECIPIISERFRQTLEKFGVDNIFYKRIYLTSVLLGMREPCWLAVPPRICCLDKRKSVIEVENNEFFEDDELIKTVTKIVIDFESIGYFNIFKLPFEYDNQEIIVSESLKNTLEKQQLRNVYFSEIKGV